jgi:hypothetical protein
MYNLTLSDVQSIEAAIVTRLINGDPASITLESGKQVRFNPYDIDKARELVSSYYFQSGVTAGRTYASNIRRR